jgi:hypothetical protein
MSSCPIVVVSFGNDDSLKRDQEERLKQLKQLEAEYLASLTHELTLRVGKQIEDPESRRIVKKLCQRLMNIERRITITQPVKLHDVGRIISDVLLGAGIEYEV